MILYADTSGLLKLYVEEAGSPEMRRLVEGARLIGTSLITYAEACSGLARARAFGRMTGSAYANSLRRFENDWPQFEAVAVTNELVRTSGRLAERHLLRGFDSVHLASALALQQGSEGVTFSAWDGRLLAAAESEGLVVAPIGPDLPIA